MKTDPELVIHAGWILLDEGTVVGGDVAMMRVFFQHVDLSFDLLLFILSNTKENTQDGDENIAYPGPSACMRVMLRKPYDILLITFTDSLKHSSKDVKNIFCIFICHKKQQI